MKALVLCLCVGFLLFHVATASGISFEETMEGFFSNSGSVTDSDAEFLAAYENGQQLNQTFSFHLKALVPSMDSFLKDVNHTVPIDTKDCYSKIYWNSKTFCVVGNSYILLFDGGVHKGNILYMRYQLYFTEISYKQAPAIYQLQGLKHVYGNYCAEALPALTTLYFHVFQPDSSISATGIVKINSKRLVEFLESFRPYPSISVLSFLYHITQFADFFASNVGKDCFHNVTQQVQSKFWYVWSSSITEGGFLLDIIARSFEVELRVEVYQPTMDPIVVKQFLPLDSLQSVETSALTRLEIINQLRLLIDQQSLNGAVNGSINSQVLLHQIEFQLTRGKQMHFAPTILLDKLKWLLPNVQSQYGNAKSGTIESKGKSTIPLSPSLPFVYTHYVIPMGMGLWKWTMVSAMQFEGTDLQIETMGLTITGSTDYLASSFVFYKGKSYELNDPVLLETKVVSDGSLEQQGIRLFEYRIHKLLTFDFSISCFAPTNQFAELEQEGKTTIHTTVMGKCTVTDLKAKQSFESTNSGVLLEVKY